MSSIEEALAGATQRGKTERKRDWQELPRGCVIPEAGNSRAYQTGDWRTQRPVIDFDNCIQCFFCWVFCPDSAIRTENKKVVGVDLYHCKGCGICAQECPKKCIELVDEEAALRKEMASASSAESGS